MFLYYIKRFLLYFVNSHFVYFSKILFVTCIPHTSLKNRSTSLTVVKNSSTGKSKTGSILVNIYDDVGVNHYFHVLASAHALPVLQCSYRPG